MIHDAKKYYSNAVWAVFTVICLLVGTAVGYVVYSIKQTAFVTQIEREAEQFYLLTSSYTSAYSDIRRNVRAKVPVPAQFSAQAHVRFNRANQGVDRMVALMVGMPGKEIVTAPLDAQLVEQLTAMSHSAGAGFAPVNGMHSIDGKPVFRSVFPSIATESNCVSCHNSLQVGVHTWQQGDLMGAYVIDNGIEPELQQIKVHSALFGLLTAIALFLAGVVTHQYRKLLEQSAALRRLANTDSLTQCHNRRSLFMMIDRIHQQQGCAGGLLSLDVDHFKNVNDQFGHARGDQLLLHIANVIRREIRSEDILSRIGGEEFVVFLPGADKQLSLDMAKRLCQSVAEQPLLADGTEIPVTVSIGLVQIRSTTENILSQWLEAADRLLYKAKKLGRNQVCYLPEAHTGN